MPTGTDIQAEQAAGLAILTKAASGGSLSADEFAAADLLLIGLRVVLAQNEHIARLVYGVTIHERRNASLASDPAA
jgi:hypothetical protein